MPAAVPCIAFLLVAIIACDKAAMSGNQGAKIIRNQNIVVPPTPTPEPSIEPGMNEQKLTNITIAGISSTAVAGTSYIIEINTLDKDNKPFTPSEPLTLSASTSHAKFDTSISIKDGSAKVPIQLFKTESLTIKIASLPLQIEKTFAITVTPAPATKFNLSAVSLNPISGSAIAFTLTALDSYDNIDSNYRGKVTATSNHASDVMENCTFTAIDKGVCHFTNSILRACGPRQITLSDSKITKTFDILVAPSSFSFSTIASPLVANQTFDLTITALDVSHQTCIDYDATITLTSSDTGFITQTPTLINGTKTISGLTFTTEDWQTLTAANNQVQSQSIPTRILKKDTIVGTNDDETIEFGQRYSTSTSLVSPDVSDNLDGGGGNNTLQLSGHYDETIVLGANIKNFQSIEILDAGFNYVVRLDTGVSGIQSINASSLGDANLHLDAFAYRSPLIIRGGNGDDVLEGGKSTDLLLGNDGNNTLIGGYDGDEIIGGSGDDHIYPDGLAFSASSVDAPLAFWLNAAKPTNSSSIPAHASSITEWQDLSGHNNHAKNVDGMGTVQANSPVFEKNITAAGGLPGIRFSAADQDTQNVTRLYFTNHFFNSPNATFIGVGRHETCATQSGIFFQDIASTSQMQIGCGHQATALTAGRGNLLPEERNFFFFRDSQSNTQDLYPLTNSNWASTATTLWSVTLDSDKLEVTSSLGGANQSAISMTNANPALSYDETTTFHTAIAGTDSQRRPAIGATASATGSWKGEGWNGHIYEFIGFMTVLSENQKNRVEEYLSMKYKLSRSGLLQGHDTLTGGLGKDTFYFNNATISGTDSFSRDQITDFSPGVDKIDFKGFDIDRKSVV